MNEPLEPQRANRPGPDRRSQGQFVVARALWYVKPGIGELRHERLAPPRPGEVRIATQFSALSRGTERLVALGEIPESEWNRMRAPMQSGAFPFPVKYGYSATGIVTAGAEEWVGRRVFALHPHQDVFHAPLSFIVPIPESIPMRRATLAANMETALNAHWDAGTGPGDRVLVIGAGIVGLLTAYLARRIAGTAVTICDVDPECAKIAAALGLSFTPAAKAPRDNRIVFQASASAAGLQTALDACAFEGTVIEMSWYGTRPVTVDLGGTFHSRRLKIVSSQVGHVAQSRRATVTARERLQQALGLLDDAALNALVADDIAFDALPGELPRIWSERGAGLPPVVRYGSSDDPKSNVE